MKLQDTDTKILAGLMKNSKMSDRKLADSIGVSQPTVTRRRARLEKELSLDYTVLPDFTELGMEIMAFHFVRWMPKKYVALSQKKEYRTMLSEFFAKHTNMIFASYGRGLGMSRIAITLHRDYSDLVSFRRQVEETWGEFMANYDVFIVSLEGDRIMRALTLRYLADYVASM